MLKRTFMKVGKGYIESLVFSLSSKNLVILKGSKGYIMCGYLNQAAAQKFGDAAVKVTGVSDIKSALKAQVFSCTSAAAKLGIYPGQSVKEVLQLIA